MGPELVADSQRKLIARLPRFFRFDARRRQHLVGTLKTLHGLIQRLNQTMQLGATFAHLFQPLGSQSDAGFGPAQDG